MATFRSTASLGKLTLSKVPLVGNSPRSRSEGCFFWEDPCQEENAWRGRTKERVLAAINDTSGRLGSVFLIGHSWCASPGVFLFWRTIIFMYLVLTLVVLSYRKAFVTHEISMGIYVAQLFASFLTVLSGTLVFYLVRKEKSNVIHEQITWPHERLRISDDRKHRGDKIGLGSAERMTKKITRTTNLLALFFTQNCCSLVILWNAMFWVKLKGTEPETSTSQANDLLLHFYNLIPVLYEIVAGCAVFHTVGYIPSFLAVVFILGHILSELPNDPTSQHLDNSAWTSRRRWDIAERIFQILVLHILCCGFITVVQRARQRLIRMI